MLAGMRIFIELPDQQLQQNPLSEVLCGETPRSVHREALFWYRSTTKDHPSASVFDVIVQDAHTQATFDEAMTEFSLEEDTTIVEA